MIGTMYVENQQTIPNPERGFYRHGFAYYCNETEFPLHKLEEFFNDGIRLVMCYYRLDKTKDEVDLQRLTQQATRVKAKGMKMILRFFYTESETGDDAPPERVLTHSITLRTSFKATPTSLQLFRWDLLERGGRVLYGTLW